MTYKNGQIPLSALVALSVKSPTLGTQYATARVAAAYERLNKKFRAQFGKDLVPTEAYRSLARQKALRNAYLLYVAGKGPRAALAAIPGTSNHGWAEAIDFGSGVATYGTAEKEWLNEHGPEEGFYPTGDRFNPREAWHFDDTNTVLADTGIPTQISTKKDDDMTTIYYQPSDNSDPLTANWTSPEGLVFPAGTSRIWSGDGRLLFGQVYSDLWERTGGNVRRLTKIDADRMRALADAGDIPPLVINNLRGNELEQIVYAPKL